MPFLPRITILTICYNSEDTIEQTIRSVAVQDYPNKEYIVIDGASTDGTMSIVNRYKQYIDFCLSEPDKGISDAFNKGITHSTGELIVCLNSDDYLLPNVLFKVATHYDEQTDIFCGNLILLDKHTNNKYILHPSTDYPVMPFFRKPAHQGAFIRKSLYEKIGGYDIKIHYAMDLDFLMRATRHGARFQHLDFEIAVFSLGGATSESILKKRKEYLYIIQKNGGSWLQAQVFYIFLFITQTLKNLLKGTGVDWVRMIRYRRGNRIY